MAYNIFEHGVVTAIFIHSVSGRRTAKLAFVDGHIETVDWEKPTLRDYYAPGIKARTIYFDRDNNLLPEVETFKAFMKFVKDASNKASKAVYKGKAKAAEGAEEQKDEDEAFDAIMSNVFDSENKDVTEG